MSTWYRDTRLRDMGQRWLALDPVMGQRDGQRGGQAVTDTGLCEQNGAAAAFIRRARGDQPVLYLRTCVAPQTADASCAGEYTVTPAKDLP